MDEDISDGEDVRLDAIVGRGSRYIEKIQMKTQDELSSLVVREVV
jgi:hypothetical protein